MYTARSSVTLRMFEDPTLRGSRLNVAVICGFFFFQAEDGIRDSSVTGVQTCALPISFDAREQVSDARHRFVARADGSSSRPPRELFATKRCVEVSTKEIAERAGVTERSEERRVGKEGRSRWSPYH